MSEREALLAAIRANPRDEALRLVYADWLDEHGDEQDRQQAAFIRHQCGLEPLRDRHHDEVGSWEDRDRWLGRPLNDHSWEHYEHSSFEFRRGLMERATMPAAAYLGVADLLAERFPAFHELRLFDLHGRCQELAECPHLRGVRVLALFAYEFTDEDAAALAGSAHLSQLEELHVWVFGPEQALRCRQIAALPSVKEVYLHHLWGGIESGDPEGADREAEDLVRRFEEAGNVVVRLIQPWARKFPLCGDVWRDLFAGHTRDGRQTLVLAGRMTRLLFFDDEGQLVGEEVCPLDGVLVRPPEHSWETYNEGELLEVLQRMFGFELGLIHVREFSTDEIWVGLPYLEGEIRDILFWTESGNFEINYGGGDSWWAGPEGKVHTT